MSARGLLDETPQGDQERLDGLDPMCSARPPSFGNSRAQPHRFSDPKDANMLNLDDDNSDYNRISDHVVEALPTDEGLRRLMAQEERIFDSQFPR